MPRTKKTTKTESRISSKVSKSKTEDSSIIDKMQNDLEGNQSYLNIILGGLIIIILGVLIFNWFNKSEGNIGPAQDTTQSANADVSKDNLPGTYTVKEGDTLFTIAQKYYDDGYKYSEIVKENKFTNENVVTVGQKITIPKLEVETAMASNNPTAAPTASPENAMTPEPSMTPAASAMQNEKMGTGGAINQTIWGETITGKTYTVMYGDWLSTIAGRAYGDIYAYKKIATANNLTNPDSIEIGQVLKLPR